MKEFNLKVLQAYLKAQAAERTCVWLKRLACRLMTRYWRESTCFELYISELSGRYLS